MSKPAEPTERPRRRTARVDAPPPSAAAADAGSMPPMPTSESSAARAGIKPEERRSRIAVSAYLRAERRGFQPGFEVEDWLSAEQEVDQGLLQGPSQTRD